MKLHKFHFERRRHLRTRCLSVSTAEKQRLQRKHNEPAIDAIQWIFNFNYFVFAAIVCSVYPVPTTEG